MTIDEIHFIYRELEKFYNESIRKGNLETIDVVSKTLDYIQDASIIYNLLNKNEFPTDEVEFLHELFLKGIDTSEKEIKVQVSCLSINDYFKKDKKENILHDILAIKATTRRELLAEQFNTHASTFSTISLFWLAGGILSVLIAIYLISFPYIKQPECISKITKEQIKHIPNANTTTTTKCKKTYSKVLSMEKTTVITDNHGLDETIKILAPVFSKIAIIVIFMSFGAFCFKRYTINRRIFEEYSHKELLATNIRVGQDLFDGILNNKDTTQKFIEDSISKILEDPLEKIYNKDGVEQDESFSALEKALNLIEKVKSLTVDKK